MITNNALIQSMLNIFKYKDFRSFLHDSLKSRTKDDPAYSLRRFSRDLKVSPARISEILSTNCGLSMALAVKIATALDLETSEQNYFLDLVRSQHSKVKSEKLEAKKRVDLMTRSQKTVLLDEKSGMLSEWYYLPLLELLILTPVVSDQKIRTILKLSDSELQNAKNFLISIGALGINTKGYWEKKQLHLKIQSQTPSEAIRNFHKDFLKRAQDAIEQPIEERKFLSGYISLRAKTLPKARKELEAFHQEFLTKYAASAADEVYCFSLQLFRLT